MRTAPDLSDSVSTFMKFSPGVVFFPKVTYSCAYMSKHVYIMFVPGDEMCPMRAGIEWTRLSYDHADRYGRHSSPFQGDIFSQQVLPYRCLPARSGQTGTGETAEKQMAGFLL